MTSLLTTAVHQPNLGRLLRQMTPSKASLKAREIYKTTDTGVRAGNVVWWSYHFHCMYNLMPPLLTHENNPTKLNAEHDIFDKEYNHSYDASKLGKIMKEAAIFIETNHYFKDNHINDIVDCLNFDNLEEKEFAKHKLSKTAQS